MYKAISLWQPWASLWVSGIKIHETRHWPTKHRGWLAVHAAKRIEHDGHSQRLNDILDSEFGGHWGMKLPSGAIVGRVFLVDCKPTDSMTFQTEMAKDDYECGNFAPGRFAWEASVFEAFPKPIPYRGAQGMFTVPDEIMPRLYNAA